MPAYVTGYREFLRACDRAGKESKRYVRATLRKTGEVVRTDAASRFARYDARTAAGYRVYVRQRGVSVEQALRKTTGLRPDFGALQMRKALVPAAADNEQRFVQELEDALDTVADHFEQGP